MGIGDAEEIELLVRHYLLEILKKPKLSKSAFDRDLPEGGDADDDVVVRVAELPAHLAGYPA